MEYWIQYLKIFLKRVVTDKDIRENFPEGGCNLPCDARLACGHTCQLSCHAYDSRHEEYKCRKVRGIMKQD